LISWIRRGVVLLTARSVEMVLQVLKTALAPPAWRILAGSWRMQPKLDPADIPAPVIFACLHRDILPAIRFVQPVRPSLLVSNSPDGDILVRTLGRGNFSFVRGSTGSGGERALVGLRRELEGGRSIGIAVDGPKGPFGEVQDGVLHLARLTGVSILPLRVQPASAWILRTWDRTVVPRPGTQVRMAMAPALPCDRSATQEELAAMKAELARFFAQEEVGA